MEFRCCEFSDDTIEVCANDPHVNNSVFMVITEGGVDTSLALSSEDAIKLAKELVRLAEG